LQQRQFIFPIDGTILDIITEVDAAAHGSQIATRLEMLEVPRR
jgi:trehalose-6-phosphatase